MSEKLLKVRRKTKRKKPEFVRQEYFKKTKKVGLKWRRPRGSASKSRIREKGHQIRPSPGYRSPAAVRGLSRDGMQFLRVFNLNDLEGADPAKQKIVLAATVGKKKRIELLRKAEEKGFKVLNFNV